MKERVGKLGTIALGASIALSACGNGEKPTTKPTIQPTEKPTPTLTSNPTIEVTPGPTVTPTLEVTPSPEPSPTPEVTPSPYTLISILESEPVKVKASVVSDYIKDAWENNENIKNNNPLDYMMTKWKNCQIPSGTIGDPDLDRELACRGLMNYLSRDRNNPTNIDEYSYKAVKGIYNYALTTLPKPYGKDIISYFKELLQ